MAQARTATQNPAASRARMSFRHAVGGRYLTAAMLHRTVQLLEARTSGGSNEPSMASQRRSAEPGTNVSGPRLDTILQPAGVARCVEGLRRRKGLPVTGGTAAKGFWDEALGVATTDESVRAGTTSAQLKKRYGNWTKTKAGKALLEEFRMSRAAAVAARSGQPWKAKRTPPCRGPRHDLQLVRVHLAALGRKSTPRSSCCWGRGGRGEEGAGLKKTPKKTVVA
ncbi:hypothetical protein T492DRAFT_1128122 [Pavlovales sp. CCMP2436]|nr:hypothetical protein T492DRAFT_1128122 [Pavlovales sp. CCMP2436]